MKHNKSEKGQALIIITFAIIGLVALTGLAVDGSMAYADRRRAQNSADSAAYAAALAVVRSKDPQAAAQSASATNGYKDTNSVIVVNTTVLPAGTCPGGATGKDIKVDITTKVKTSFGLIVGIKEITNKVTTTTRECDGINQVFFSGNGLVALNKTASPACQFNSNAHVEVNDSGMFCNSSAGTAMGIDSNVDIVTDTGTGIVGGVDKKNNAVVTGGLSPNLGAGQQLPYPPDLSWIPTIPLAPVSCTGMAAAPYDSATHTYSPGLLTNQNPGGAAYTFNPGTYCIGGGNNFNSNTTINATGGKVIFILGSNGLTFNSNFVANFSDWEIYSTSGSINFNSNGNVTATRFRFFSTGSGVFNLNSNVAFQSDNFFYTSATGQSALNSNSTVKISPPPAGDPFAKICIYLPLTNDKQFIMNSNGNMDIAGMILAPAAQLVLNSNSTILTHDSQIVVNTYIINSNANLSIGFNSAALPGASAQPTIKLLK